MSSETAWRIWRCYIAQWHDELKRSGEGMGAVPDNLRTEQPHVQKNTVQLLASLLHADRWWTARQLAAVVGVCHKTVLHILHDILSYRKFAAHWIRPDITTMQSQGLFGSVPKGRWLLSWTNCRCWRNLGSLIRTNLETPIKWMEESRFSSPKKLRPTQCAVKMMFIVAYGNDGVIFLYAVYPRLPTTARSCSTTFVQHPWGNYSTWWYRTPSFFMTMQRVTPLLLSRTSSAAGNGLFWNIHRIRPTWIHAITIFSPKWKNHCERAGKTQEMNVSML